MAKSSLFMQILAASSGTMVYLIAGMITGWTSPTVARLTEGKDEPYLTDGEAAWMASIIFAPQVITCLPSSYLADTLGRKTTLLGTSVPFLLSWLLIAFGNTLWMLYAARLVAGIALGISNTVAPMYVIEVAEDRVRGALGTLFMLMMNIGIVFEDCVAPYVSRAVVGGLSAIFPVLFAVTFFWMPESPYYYLIRNRKEDAEKSLRRLRSGHTSEEIKEELDKMESFVIENAKNKGSFKELFCRRGNRKAFLIMFGFLTFQNFSGIVAVMSYSTSIFKESGIKLDASITVIIMGVMQTVLSMISSSTVDIAGRRPMLLVCTSGCAIALAVEGTHFYLKTIPGQDMSGLDWMPLSAMSLYIITFSIGLGPIPNMVISEMFPTNVKGMALSISTILVAIYSTITAKVYQLASEAYGAYAVFWTFAIVTALNVVFIAIMVPETKGKSLMEIHEELSSSKSCGNKRKKEKRIDNVPVL